MGMALVATGIAGGVLALIWAGMPRIVERIAGWFERSRFGVLDKGYSSPSEFGSR